VAVTTDIIATDLGVAPPTDLLVVEQWELWISDAEMLIEERRVKVGFDGAIDPAKIDYAVRRSVVDHIKHPDDATQVTISVDDGSTARRYESGRGRVSVDDWWDYLGLADDSSGAWTVRPAGRTPDVVFPW